MSLKAPLVVVDDRGVRPSRSLYAAVTTCVLASLCFGYNTASIAGAQLSLERDMSFMQSNGMVSPWGKAVCSPSGRLSHFQLGLSVACILASSAIGCIFVSPFSEVYGRRAAHALNAIVFVIGPTMMALAPSFAFLVAARCFTGLAVGGASQVCNLYISEISPATVRGRLGTLAPLIVTLGILLAYVVSYWLNQLSDCSVSWRLQLGLGAIPAIAQLFLFRFLVETPRWLICKGRTSDAFNVYERVLTADSKMAVSEFIASEVESVAKDVEDAADAPRGFRTLLTWRAARPLIISVGVQVLQQVSGINVVIYFGPRVLKSAGFDNSSATGLTAGVSVAQLLAVFFLSQVTPQCLWQRGPVCLLMWSFQVIDRWGRRPMTLLGSALMLVGLAMLGGAFVSLWEGSTGGSWLAVAGMLVFRIAFSLSLGPVPYLITSEVFPTEMRSPGISVSWACNWISNFGVNLCFPLLVAACSAAVSDSYLGNAIVFGIFATMCSFAIVFILKLMPETRGVNLEELGRTMSPRDAGSE